MFVCIFLCVPNDSILSFKQITFDLLICNLAINFICLTISVVLRVLFCKHSRLFSASIAIDNVIERCFISSPH